MSPSRKWKYLDEERGMLMMNKLYDLQLFAGEANTQTTGHGGLSAEMKTYYGMELLENAKPQLVHNLSLIHI